MTLPRPPRAGASPLDRFLPHPDIRERFETTVQAPAELVMRVASEFDMQSLPVVRAIFQLRELLTGSRASARVAQGILAETRSLGWGLLAEQPGRLVVCGARCQPWRADVQFIAIPAEDFAAYTAPGQVKIAWTIEAVPLGPARTRLVQENRAVATDAPARAKFRRYWRWARFGIVTIRWLMLPAVRREAEREWAGGTPGDP